MVAPKVRHLHLLNAGPNAHAVAKTNLARVGNVSFHLTDVRDIPLDAARSISRSIRRPAPRA
jgi:hypothetical protein